MWISKRDNIGVDGIATTVSDISERSLDLGEPGVTALLYDNIGVDGISDDCIRYQ